LFVICGYLWSSGIGFSTVLAQSVPIVLPPPVATRRKGISSASGHAGLPSPQNEHDGRLISVSYCRYSSDNQDETSIEDQQRLSLQVAEEKGFRHPSERQYADYAISGTKLKREGLDRLLEDARLKKFDVVIFYNLSRLARESVIGMPILKKLVFEYGIRFISVSESIDSDNPSWVILATMLLLQHENYIADLSKNVHRGQEGAVLRGFAVGDHRFGYRSVPSPVGSMTGRGRNAKPRMIYQIHPEEAEWVRNIYSWFVEERRSISWIAGELNRRNVSKDHRSSTARWHPSQVVGVLTSEKYIGKWTWGLKRNKRTPSTGQLSQVARPESETNKWTRALPELRIITDEIFFAAQDLRKKYLERPGMRDAEGKVRGRVTDRNLQHLLAGLLRCKLCGSTFHTAGANCNYMSCSGYKCRICKCRTMVPRQLAQKLILAAVGQLMKCNATWLALIIDLTKKAVEAVAREQPTRLISIEQDLKKVAQMITRLLDQLETRDDPEIGARLAQRQRERGELQRELKEIQRNHVSLPPIPIEEWIGLQMERLAEVMNSGTPAATLALHNLLDGPIVMEEIPHEDRVQCHWRGTFRVRVGRVIVDRGSNVPGIGLEIADNEDHFLEFSIDFREQSKTEGQAALAWQLLKEDRPIKEIAGILGVSRGRMTAILNFAAKERGEVRVDGRARRSTLPDTTRPPTLGDLKTEEVMVLYQQGLLLGDIAEKLQIDRNTVTAVVAKWHEKQGLPVPDGRTRRKSLNAESSSDNLNVSDGESKTDLK
jgi:site-specific DNA recombinase